MSIQILAAPLTGKTWLHEHLRRLKIPSVELDYWLNWALKELGYENRVYPVYGPPPWLIKAQNLALKHMPLDAIVYIGNCFPLPFTPSAIFFLIIDNFEFTYRRACLPFLPRQFHHLPVTVYWQILMAENISPTQLKSKKIVPLFENFVRFYLEMKQNCPKRTIFLNSNDLLAHILLWYTTFTAQRISLQSVNPSHHTVRR